MSEATNITRQLENLLREQLRHIGLLTQYLDEIRTTVSGNGVNELERLLQSGCPSLATLDSLQQRQNELLRQQGYGSGPQGLLQWLDKLDCPGLKTLGESLLQKLQQLQKSLLINDLLVRKNQDRVRQSIRILNGRDSQTLRPTYSSNGHADQREQERRHLATA